MKIKSSKFVKSALSLFLVLLMLLSCGITSILSANVDLVSTGVDHSGGYIYFDNSVTKWTDSKIMLFIGKDSYTSVYEMKKITGTNLYYYSMPSWGGATYCAVAGAGSLWGSGSWGPSNRTNATHYTNVYNNYGFNSGSTYVITPASSSNNCTISISYESSGYSALNSNQTVGVKVAENGSNTYSIETNTGITVNASSYRLNGNGTSTTTSGTTAVAAKSADVTLSYSGVPTGYTFKGWYNSSGTQVSTDATYTYEATGTADYYAYFEKPVSKVTATFNNWDGTQLQSGSVNSGTTPVYSGLTPTRESDAQYTYSFSGWEPELGNITADETYTAQFTSTLRQYTVTASASAGGSVTGGGTYNYGTSVTLTATGSDGYVFTGWTGLPLGTDATSETVTFTLTGNVTAVANYTQAKTYNVDAQSSNAEFGNVTSPQKVAEGGSLTLKATETEKGYFLNWVINGTTYTTQEVTLTDIQADVTATANFREKQGTVNFAAGANGSVSSTGGTVVYSGEGQSTATPAVGYNFSGWTISSAGAEGIDYEISTGDATSTTLGIKIITDGTTVTATANFTVKSYTVTFLDGQGNTVDTQTVNHGDSAQTPTSPERPNYTFDGWDTDYNEITADTTVTAKWKANIYDISVSAGTGGNAVSSTESFTYSDTDSVTLTATTEDGYKFSAWTITGDYEVVGDGDLQSATLTIRPTSDITANAEFIKGQYITIYYETYSSSYKNKLHMWEKNSSGGSKDLTGGWGNDSPHGTKQFGTETWNYMSSVEFSAEYNSYVGVIFHGDGQTGDIELTDAFYPNGSWVNKPEIWLYNSNTTSVIVTFRTELNATYNAYKDRTDIGYTPESWAEFQSALSTAKTTLSNKSAEQSEIDSANTALINAEANLQLQTYNTVTFSHVGAEGTVEGNTQVATGKTATFTVTAPEGYYVSAVSGAGVGTIEEGKVVEFTTGAINADETVTITYTANPLFTLTEINGSGTVNLKDNNNPSITYTYPGSGTGVGIEYSTRLNITVTAPAGMYISKIVYTNQNDDGTTTIDVATQSGSWHSFTVNSTVFNFTQLTMEKNRDFTVYYENIPTVTVTEAGAEENGTVTISPEVVYNGNTTVSITAPEGYFISGISQNGTSIYSGDSETKLNHTINLSNITSNVAIIVNYTERATHTITVEAYDDTKGTLSVGGGAIPAAGQSWEVYSGEEVNITVTTNEGFVVENWTINGSVGNEGVTALNLSAISEDKTIAVNFKEISIYNVTVDTNPYGGGTATGTVNGGIIAGTTVENLSSKGTYTTKIEENGTVTFTVAEKDPAYKFTGWKITGSYGLTSGTLADTTITVNPKSDVKVVATFKQAYMPIYLDNDANWSTPINIHYWGGSEGSSWPGIQMTAVDGVAGRFVAYVPIDSTAFKFNQSSNPDGVNSNDVAYETGRNLYNNAQKAWEDNSIVEPGIYLQGSWNGNAYSAYDHIKFDEGRDNTYTITLDVISAPDGFITVNPTDEGSNFWHPADGDYEGSSPVTLTTGGTYDDHNVVKIPLDMEASSNGYTVTITFNSVTGEFSWEAVAKVPTITVYGTNGAANGAGVTFFDENSNALSYSDNSTYYEAEVPVDEFFSIFTQINAATDSPTGLTYEWKVAGYVINGKDYVPADALGNGLFTADIRLSEDYDEADIVPIYFHEKAYLDYYNIKTTTFYAIIPDGVTNWTDSKKYLAAYTWYYKDGETDSCYSPFGTYPGQLMIPIPTLNGVYYTIVEAMAPTKNDDGSAIYVDGVTLNNFNSTAPSNETAPNVQTYDFYEFMTYTTQGRENITFVLKNHNDNYNRQDVNETQIDTSNFSFVELTNYNNELIDLFGTVVDRETFDAQIAAGKYFNIVRVGNKNYKDITCTYDHYDAKTGEATDCHLRGEWYVDYYLYDNAGNFITKGHSYQLSDGSLWKSYNKYLAENGETEFASLEEFQAAFAGYVVNVSYETDTVVDTVGKVDSTDKSSDATRFDGEWYADTSNSVTVDISVNVALTTDGGKTFTKAVDAEGNFVNTAEYGTATVDGEAIVAVSRNSVVTLYAQRETGYRFIGWANADGTIFSSDITVTTDVAINTAYTAVYEKLQDGVFYLNHYIYGGEGTAPDSEVPDAHNGRGDLYVQIEKLDEMGNVTADTGLLKQNTVSMDAQEGETLRLTIATDAAGLDYFFAWYVNAVNAAGTSYEEVGVDSVDNLAMPGNGGTYTNPDTVIGSKDIVYFQFMHTVGKQFNINLYSDMIRESSIKKLIYRYNDRAMGQRDYVVYYELTTEEIEGFEGNGFRTFTPSDETIAKFAPFVGDYYKDVEWVITDFAPDECLLWGVNKTKTYTVTTNINGAVNVEKVKYNTVATYDASAFGYSNGGFWYKDIDENGEYNDGDIVIANGTAYSYLVTEDMTIGYVPEKLNDFTVQVDDPVYGREQYTDSEGNNKTDKVLVDYVINMVTPFVYTNSNFTPIYGGEEITDINMVGNMVTIESLINAGYEFTFGYILEQVGSFAVTPDSTSRGSYDTYAEAEAAAKLAGYGTATDSETLVDYIENGKFGMQNGKYYANYEKGIDLLTNKNRYHVIVELDNTASYRPRFYNMYAYMTVKDPDGNVKTYISNVQTLNIYPTALIADGVSV